MQAIGRRIVFVVVRSEVQLLPTTVKLLALHHGQFNVVWLIRIFIHQFLLISTGYGIICRNKKDVNDEKNNEKNINKYSLDFSKIEYFKLFFN